MAGMVDKIIGFFTGMPEPVPQLVPQGHWKREETDYLTKIGAMNLINKDPLARLGYKVRAHPEYQTLNMGGDAGDAYGNYIVTPSLTEPPPGTVKRNGEMNVAVDMTPSDYAATLAHELGHVGARNSKTEAQHSYDSRHGVEELRQRVTDLLINPVDSRPARQARYYLKQNGLTPREIDRRAGIQAKVQGIVGGGK